MTSSWDMTKKITSPFARIYRHLLSKEALQKGANGFANFVYSHGKDVATMMLFAFAASTISSHIAQRNGLKKSDRENKEFLMQQENTELGLDLALTIIPPFVLKNILNKKLCKGEILTHKTKDFMQNTLASVVGVNQKDLYYVHPKPPLKYRIERKIVDFQKFIREHKLLPKSMLKRMRIKNLPPYIPPSRATLEDMTTDFDILIKQYKTNQILAGDDKPVHRTLDTITDKLYKGSAYSDVCGEKEGLLIASTVLYTIVAANIIMPILKNKIANKRYREELALIGETPESIKRKRRFNFYDTELRATSDDKIFNRITHCDKNGKYIDKRVYQGLYTPSTKNKTFSTFNNINGLKI